MEEVLNISMSFFDYVRKKNKQDIVKTLFFYLLLLVLLIFRVYSTDSCIDIWYYLVSSVCFVFLFILLNDVFIKKYFLTHSIVELKVKENRLTLKTFSGETNSFNVDDVMVSIKIYDKGVKFDELRYCGLSVSFDVDGEVYYFPIDGNEEILKFCCRYFVNKKECPQAALDIINNLNIKELLEYA